jgi:hypothetical protein
VCRADITWRGLAGIYRARSTGEPSEKRTITCDAAAHLPDLLPERTFWKKATAMHVYCARS